MISQYLWLAIAVGVFFAGLGVGYTVFQFYNQQNFANMTPQQMQQMMNDPQLRKQMYGMMFQNQQFMQEMMNNPQFQNQWTNPMMSQSMMGSGMNSTMDKMQFNPNVPITIPMIDGYYDGKKVFFIHTEVTSNDMANMMTNMINFPILHNPDLKNVPSTKLGNIYVFTNGVKGLGPYGGGPFLYQIDVFDSIPDQDGYSQFRIPNLVTWYEDANPRLLTSVDEILKAEENGELMIRKTEDVVNAPMVVWYTDDGRHATSSLDSFFLSMPNISGKVVNTDEVHYIITLNFQSMENMMMK